MGLLGYVQHDLVRGEWRQRFLRPGEATLEPDGVLPPATHYLLHPVLLGRDRPPATRPSCSAWTALNIVGYDRPWRDPAGTERPASVRTLCVLKADVHAFGGLMRAGADAPVRQALEDAVHALGAARRSARPAPATRC